MTPPSLRRGDSDTTRFHYRKLAAMLVKGCVGKSDSTEMNLRHGIGRTLGITASQPKVRKCAKRELAKTQLIWEFLP